MSLDLLPMLLLSLLLMTASGTDVQTAELILGGQHEATAHRGALIVGDGDVTVPADSEVSGPIHVLGGTLHVLGTVDGDIAHVAGTLIVGEQARVTGTLQEVGGSLSVAPTADVARRTAIDLGPADAGLVQRYLPLGLLTGVLALVAARRARRRPGALTNISEAAGRHPGVSLTVGALVTVTALALLVFMAFTLVLLPVSIFGLVVGLVALAYGIIALGHRLGQRLPIAHAGAAAAAGTVGVMALLTAVGRIPVLGDVLVAGVSLTALGAVLITYLGLQPFTPAPLPD
jgi:cytoskeletal protein CcmA (bactofilin family)